MEPSNPSRLLRTHRPLLAKRVPPDAFLAMIAQRCPSHRFLGNSAQAIYQRQITLLSTLLTAYTRTPPGNISVLDWGCGKGHITYMLQKLGFTVTTCDRNVNMDDSAFGQTTPIIEHAGIRVLPLEDDVRLPFPDRTFDAVTSFGVLEHVRDDLASLREIHRVLKKGGIFYITFLPNRSSWTQAVARLRGNNYHDRLYWIRDVRRLAAKAKFTVSSAWFAQLFPKNSIPFALDSVLEPVDRALCRWTPLRYLATNLETVWTAE